MGRCKGNNGVFKGLRDSQQWEAITTYRWAEGARGVSLNPNEQQELMRRPPQERLWSKRNVGNYERLCMEARRVQGGRK